MKLNDIALVFVRSSACLASSCLAIACLAQAVLSPARAGGLVNGNDTGGIIPWSPQTQIERKLIAAEHCAHYDKDARITSIFPRYGQYIGFACRFRPPVIVRTRSITRHRGVVLRSRG